MGVGVCMYVCVCVSKCVGSMYAWMQVQHTQKSLAACRVRHLEQLVASSEDTQRSNTVTYPLDTQLVCTYVSHEMPVTGGLADGQGGGGGEG